MKGQIKAWTTRNDDVRSMKRKPEDEGECEELTRRYIHDAMKTRGRYCIGSVEESVDKNANMAMYVQIEEDYEQELTEAWRPRTRPRNGEEGTCPGDGMVQEDEHV